MSVVRGSSIVAAVTLSAIVRILVSCSRDKCLFAEDYHELEIKQFGLGYRIRNVEVHILKSYQFTLCNCVDRMLFFLYSKLKKWPHFFLRLDFFDPMLPHKLFATNLLK